MNSVMIPVQQQLPGKLRDLYTSQNNLSFCFYWHLRKWQDAGGAIQKETGLIKPLRPVTF